MTAALETYDSMTRRDVETMDDIVPAGVIAWAIVRGGALHIRDCAAGERAYHYSSGNFGPGYVLIKGAVGNQKLFKFLVRQMALRLADVRSFDFIAGLVTGGVPPSLILRDQLQNIQQREIPWVYIRDTRKEGGTREQITGIQHLATGGVNPEVPEGSCGMVMEELTNYANSLCNGAEVLRAGGYTCTDGLSLLDYAQPRAGDALRAANISLRTLITLPELLDAVVEVGAFPQRLVDDYRRFQRDPEGWMADHGYERQEHGR